MEFQIDIKDAADELEDNLEQEYILYCPYGELIVRGSVEGDAQIWLFGPNGLVDGSQVPADGAEPDESPSDSHSPVRFIREVVPLVHRVLPKVAMFSEKRQRLLEFVVNVGKPAVELVEDCPALAYLLVHRTGRLKPDRAHKVQDVLICRKRHEILSALGLPDSKWFARMLRNIPAGECCILLLKQIFEVVRSADGGDPCSCRKLNILRHHVRWINRLQIDIFHEKDVFSLLAPTFFEDIGQLAFLRNHEIIFDDLVEIRRILDQDVLAGREIAPIRSVTELAAVHERLVDLLASIQTLEKYKDVPFPDPPLQGISAVGGTGRSEILPIDSGEALWQEGRSMHHCIFSYLSVIMEDEGRLYVYHVAMADGEQATLLLKVSRETGPEIQELQGKYNEMVSPRLNQFVADWLIRAQQKECA